MERLSKKDISLEQMATHVDILSTNFDILSTKFDILSTKVDNTFDVLSTKIDNTNERITNLEQRLVSKINTMQWIGGLLTVGIFLPIVFALWQNIFK